MPRNEAAPAVFQMTPGRHTIAVKGQQAFFPSDTSIELAAEDTQTVVFRSLRFQQQQQQVQQQQQQQVPQGGAGGTASPNAVSTPQQMNWPDVVSKLGFDPRTADLRRLTPEQRQRYRRFQQFTDSVKRANPRRP